mmetsp:Transcript_52571/g.167143  ORF Transcript_52571/g.167143 Transcript_52571/m.167143 type:complete len:442 (+) Transcript_52571:103-1428(+)
MANNDAPARRQAILLEHLRGAPQRPATVPVASVEARACAAGDASAYSRSAADDVVLVSALRTPLCKAKRGMFKDTLVENLLGTVLDATCTRTGVAKEDIGDIVVGSVLGSGSQRANECRIAMLLVGFPDSVPVRTVNRQCSSGLQAIADVAASIQAGFYDIGIGAGVETMTSNPMKWDGGFNPAIKKSKQAQSCLLPMGITSENVAAKFGISRDTQDAFAAASHNKAAHAQKTGRFRSEIVPVHTTIKDKEGNEQAVTVEHDDGIRPGMSPEALGKLKAVFKEGGSTTAGNASQVTDGAAASLLMKRSEANRRGLPILGVFRSFAVVGCDPAIMGIGPAVAIPEAVKKAGLSVRDIDLFELNEAFASQATYCAAHLGLDPEKVNVNGGAIALGHPLGATGARGTATLLHEMSKRGPSCRYGVVSMCIGSGMGAAAVFERGS